MLHLVGLLSSYFAHDARSWEPKTLNIIIDTNTTNYCWHNTSTNYEVVSKIFRTETVKIVKLTIRPISHHHPRSNSLSYVDTGPTLLSIFGMLPGSPFLSESQAVSEIQPVSPWYQTGVLSASVSFLEIGRSHRVPNQGSMVGGG